MQLVYESAIRIAVDYATRYLNDLTFNLKQEATDIISYEITNMIIETLKGGGYGGITAETRAKYEGRMLEALRQIGAVKEF
jgi:hypothetical protein